MVLLNAGHPSRGLWFVLTIRTAALLCAAVVGLAVVPPAQASPLTFFDNFNDGNISGWQVIGGVWDASTGQLIGQGDGPFPPRDSRIVIQNFLAQDVFVKVDMTSLVRVDK